MKTGPPQSRRFLAAFFFLVLPQWPNLKSAVAGFENMSETGQTGLRFEFNLASTPPPSDSGRLLCQNLIPSYCRTIARAVLSAKCGCCPLALRIALRVTTIAPFSALNAIILKQGKLQPTHVMVQ